MFYLKNGLSALFLPPTGLMLIALLGVVFLRRYPRFGRWITTLSLLVLLALSLPQVADSLLSSLESDPPVSTQNLRGSQAIVILGGGNYYAAPEYGHDTVNRFTLERMRYGAYLQKRSALPVLVAGGAPLGGRAEGETMREVMEEELGGRVKWVERSSLDTAENARNSAPILKEAGITRIALVSHAWHLRRAVALFRSQGLEVLPAPTVFSTQSPAKLYRFLPSAAALERSSIALHEWLGIFVQNLK